MTTHRVRVHSTIEQVIEVDIDPQELDDYIEESGGDLCDYIDELIHDGDIVLPDFDTGDFQEASVEEITALTSKDAS